MIHDHYARTRSSRSAADPTWRRELPSEQQDIAAHVTEGTVVAGFDGSPAAGGALRWAAAQAAITGGHLDLVTAWEFPTSWGNSLPLPSDYDPARDAEAMVDPVLARLRTDYPSLDIHAHVVEGHPGDVLVEASRHADLLVVASRGHRAFAGVVLGSVSQHCVTHADCPVVVYRQPEPTD
jgi:nucleotide-binding universal stress UspA family protein